MTCNFLQPKTSAVDLVFGRIFFKTSAVDLVFGRITMGPIQILPKTKSTAEVFGEILSKPRQDFFQNVDRELYTK
jgi:hypothetical protein